MRLEQVAGGLQFQMIPDPGQDDGGADRFGDVIHRAQAKPARLIGNLGLGRQEDHRDVPVLASALRRLQTS